jgi:hypothetical protein
MNDEGREYIINGLTSAEAKMLEVMWSIQSSEDMEDWLMSLSRKKRVMAHRLKMLLLIEMIDYDAIKDLSIAKTYLKKFQL